MGPIALGARALGLIVASRVLLSRTGTTATLRRMARRRGRRTVEPQEALVAVRRAARIAGGACLPQAVALTALLSSAGADATLVLGCRRMRGTWTAHAWVEVGALVLEPVTALEHAPLAHLSAAEGWVPRAPGMRSPD